MNNRTTNMEEVTNSGSKHYMEAFEIQWSLEELAEHVEGSLLSKGFTRSNRGHANLLVYENEDKSIIVKVQQWNDVYEQGVKDECFTYSVIVAP